MVSYRFPTERGVALLLFVLALLSFSLAAMALSSQQMMGQFMHLHLQQTGIARQQEVEALFSQLALQLNEGQSGSSPGSFETDSYNNSELDGAVMPDECPHPYPTTTQCWSVRVTDRRNNVERERLLLVPAQSCSQPYWYASASSLALDSTIPPPNEEFPDDPVFPRTRPGLR
ncbi:hypothetical protein CWE12_08035 [Aliidiomarina sedimenti]|uniref:Type 4 fimbrial biogenesis protein PilX N-terminal domain-containing protein n=1 Tax=Aliidiomarina sedimenti TaxID=1933879 RepID=A0ABY0BZB7_9GAMM|nr:hypothetical protein [Aliidiomarina sedimenti]RUO29908.1 hypothetical protein CWE12_08035 [Aliidiomarina sedimenti]